MRVKVYPTDNLYLDIRDKVSRELLLEDGYTVLDSYEKDLELLQEANDLANDIAYRQQKEETLDETKFSQYQLEGEKENYKEVLVTLPVEVKELPSGYKSEKTAWDTYQIKDDKGNVVSESGGLAKATIDALAIINKSKGSMSYIGGHFSEPNILVHLRMNTRTDADGKKVLFLEEVQSDWGQTGKKEGFITKENEAKLKELQDEAAKTRLEFENIENELDRQYEAKKKYGESRAELKERDKEFMALAKKYHPAEMAAFEARRAFDLFQVENRSEVPYAPFVMDTNDWTKLGLKVALKEAVAQGVDKIAWTTGTQQFDRWGTEKIDWVANKKLSPLEKTQFDLLDYKVKSQTATQSEKEKRNELGRRNQGGFVVNIQEQFGGTAFEGMNVDEKALTEKGILVETKEDLKAVIDRALSREKNEAERQKLTDRIWDRMQKEDSGTSLRCAFANLNIMGVQGLPLLNRCLHGDLVGPDFFNSCLSSKPSRHHFQFPLSLHLG